MIKRIGKIIIFILLLPVMMLYLAIIRKEIEDRDL